MDTPQPSRTPTEWRIPEELGLRLLVHLSAEPGCARTMTYEEFLDWADDDTLAEWVEPVKESTSTR